jgi:hypothetical protein
VDLASPQLSRWWRFTVDGAGEAALVGSTRCVGTSTRRSALTMDRGRWHSGGVLLAAIVPDDPRPWSEIPGVPLIGIALGLAVVWLAIRYILRKK